MKIKNKKQIASHFNKKWWSNKSIIPLYNEIVSDLISLIDNKNKKISTNPDEINRSYLTCDYIIKNYKKNSKILDMACGYGFVTHTLTKKGYNVKAFDISKDAISIAKIEAINEGENPDKFFVSDENFLKKIKSNSLDVIIGLGYLRYLNKKQQKLIYRESKRVLKKNGTLIIDHQNNLYEMFALNNESIEFWAKFMEDYCNLKTILKKNELLKLLNRYIKTPIRTRDNFSISAKMKVYSENPLTYYKRALEMGYKLEKILYPYCDIIPPFLHKEINIKKLRNIQSKNCLKLSENWRSMFMCYQFLTFLKK